jgi:hypothetical protein
MRKYRSWRLPIWLPLLVFLSMAWSAAAQQIWFAPTDNLPRGPKLFNQDFPALFQDPPVWNTRVDVFEIAPYYAARATDADLLRIAAFLARHHIALAVSVQPTQVNGECGPGEGLTRRGENLGTFRRLRRLDLNIQYIGLDEPLTFAHYYSRGNRRCHFPIIDVARRVAATIAEIRESYPLARIVDYEAPTDAPLGAWPADLTAWLTAYKSATNTPLDAVVLDVHWNLPWIDWVRPAVNVLHRAGVRAGMFLTIVGPGSSDVEAVASLRANIQAVDAARLPLDLVIMSCWTPFPTHSVPASDPTSLTSVLNWYLATHGRPG